MLHGSQLKLSTSPASHVQRQQNVLMLKTVLHPTEEWCFGLSDRTYWGFSKIHGTIYIHLKR